MHIKRRLCKVLTSFEYIYSETLETQHIFQSESNFEI